MPRRYAVGIVGFGTGGGALAVLLARAGHAVTLFERAPQVGPVGAGILLQPSGQGVLERLGLLHGVVAEAEPISGLRVFTARGRTLIRLDYEEVLPGHCAYAVHRGRLFEALYAAVREQAVAVCLDHEIASWRVEGRGVSAVDVCGQAHGPFDFLVAADGSRSAMRSALDPSIAVHEYDFGALWAVGRCTRVRGYLHQVTQGTRHLLGLLPIGSERCTLFWSLPRDQMDVLRRPGRRGFTAWRDQVIGLSPLAQEVFADLGDFDAVAFTTYHRTSMKRPYNAHVVCLGDAAHSMSPHLGQGANLALLDAECLAFSLEEADSPSEAFSLYHGRRRGQILYYATLSRLLTPFFQSRGWVLGVGRNVALPLMSLVGPMRREMELGMAGVKRGFFAGSLEVT